ncbi:MAG: adenylate kinase family protein [Candidatus Aenigmarchaeota archaeon]|nr:adenylate kinase family protein [Candidatus Aenigmarchaeota archaeon]
MIVSITGVAGTGKTVVSKLLAKELKWKFIKLDNLAKRKKLFLFYDKERRTHVVDMKRLKKEFNKESRKYDNVVTESLYSHLFPSDILIVLRCNPKILEKRLKRKYSWSTKIKENLEAEMINLITEEAMEIKKRVYEIETTHKTPKQTVKSIREVINGKTAKYKAGRINWL